MIQCANVYPKRGHAAEHKTLISPKFSFRYMNFRVILFVQADKKVPEPTKLFRLRGEYVSSEPNCKNNMLRPNKKNVSSSARLKHVLQVLETYLLFGLKILFLQLGSLEHVLQVLKTCL